MIEMIAFDLDNTIYPASTGLLNEIDNRIARFIEECLNVDHDEAHVIRRRYLRTYGTTAQGLKNENGIDPLDFLRYVDHVPARELLKDLPREPLRKMLLDLPYRRAIFTNSTVAHADSVLSVLEIDDCFEFIHDLVAMKSVGKPNREAFEGFLEHAGLSAEKVLFLDDNGINISAASKLGVKVLMVREGDVISGLRSSATPWEGHTDIPEGVDVIENILELPEYLKKMESAA